MYRAPSEPAQITPLWPAACTTAAKDRRLSAIPVERLSKLCCCCPGTGRIGGAPWGCRMAVDDREPHQERPGELPRRVPGVNGRTPGQIRRGYLPIPDAPSSDPSATDVDLVTAAGPAGELPKRAPGTSAIQSPPEHLRRPRLPEPLSRESMATARPSPTSLASSAAKLLNAAAAPAFALVAAPQVPAPAPAPPRASPEPPRLPQPPRLPLLREPRTRRPSRPPRMRHLSRRQPRRRTQWRGPHRRQAARRRGRRRRPGLCRRPLPRYPELPRRPLPRRSSELRAEHARPDGGGWLGS